jgi:hypothetical protein
MKTLQKLRKRQNGVSIVSLALGKKGVAEDEALMVRGDTVLTRSLIVYDILMSLHFEDSSF